MKKDHSEKRISIICCVSGENRVDTPSEHLRQRWAHHLMDEYGYPRERLAIGFEIETRSKNIIADLVVFKNSEKIQSEITIIIKFSSDAEKGDNQIRELMTYCPAAVFGLVVADSEVVFERKKDGSIQIAKDIPRFRQSKKKMEKRMELQPVADLKDVFRKCHNYIHAHGGFQKAEAFHEMLKLIFCKLFDEQETGGDVLFWIDDDEKKSKIAQSKLVKDRLIPLFKKVKDRYKDMYEEGEQLKLSAPILTYIVTQLQNINFRETGIDVKGAAYEELVGENLRGDRGEYFTPRNVCDMTVQMIQSILGDETTNAKVLDCCCGTGGFLMSWIENLKTFMRKQEMERGSDNVEVKVNKRVKESCEKLVFGIDINPFLVRTARMNVLMHGDSEAHIFREDSSKPRGEWSPSTYDKIPYGRLDVVITNPPFGEEVRIADRYTLSKYDLTTWSSTKTPRSSIPAEQLFVETALKFLRPGGILGIVIPDSILNNPGIAYLRDWLLKHSQVIASVDLPKETFATSGGVNNPSMLIVRKFSKEDVIRNESHWSNSNEPVFLATPKTCGIDKRGKTIYLRKADGEMVQTEKGPLKDDEVSIVSGAFHEWLLKNPLNS